MAKIVRATGRTLLLVAVRSWACVSFVAALILTALLEWANPETRHLAALGELLMANLWVCGALNLLFVLVLLALCPLASRSRPLSAHGFPRLLSSGLIAANIVWCIWVRFPMPHQFMSQRPFLTLDGVAQNLLLAVVFGGLTMTFSAIGRRRLVGLTAAAIAILVCSEFNALNEQRHRIYPLSVIADHASRQSGDSAPASQHSSAVGPTVFIVCLDGLAWSVIAPLLESGELPNLAALIHAGSIAYLENGNLSYSPEIWATIFSGRSASAHRIFSFRKVRLHHSRAEIRDLLIMHPTIDTFYYVHWLFEHLPPLGLWTNELVLARDRLVPTIWEVASGMGRKIVIVDPIQGYPVPEVNGAMISFLPGANGRQTLASPAEVANMAPLLQSNGHGETESSFQSLVEQLTADVRLTNELVRLERPDLALFFSTIVDQVSHKNWHFFSDSFYLKNLPRDLSDAEWAEFVARNRDHRVFRVYLEVDKVLGDLVRANPSANFVILSDHGWTYSGYEHFGSPPGVLILSGPNINRGADIGSATILDVAPTVLALLNLPLSRELEGRVLGSAVSVKPTLDTVDSYGRPAVMSDPMAGQMIRSESEMVDQLRALGYVK